MLFIAIMKNKTIEDLEKHELMAVAKETRARMFSDFIREEIMIRTTIRLQLTAGSLDDVQKMERAIMGRRELQEHLAGQIGICEDLIDEYGE